MLVRNSNPLQFLKAAVIVACGVFLVLNSGRHRWQFEGFNAKDLERYIGVCLIFGGAWYYSSSGGDDGRDDDDLGNVTPRP